MLYMDMNMSGHVAFARLARIVHRFTQHWEEGVTAQTLDAAIQQQIRFIEQSIHEMETRPSKVIYKAQPLPPLTEQQKIIDLAG